MQSLYAGIRVVIPARYGSSRLPGKPLIDLAGKPLVVRVHEVVRAAIPHAEIVVAVDDNRISDALAQWEIPVMMTDPGHESGTDRVAEVARALSWNSESIIINVQGDEPLVPAALLQSFAAFCVDHAQLTMATVAVPLETVDQLHDPNIVKLCINARDNAITFSRAGIPFHRDLPLNTWPLDGSLRHVGLYAYRNDILQKLTAAEPCSLERAEKLEQLRALWLGIPINVMRWHESPPHGVDTSEDAARVDRLFRDRQHNASTSSFSLD